MTFLYVLCFIDNRPSWQSDQKHAKTKKKTTLLSSASFICSMTIFEILKYVNTYFAKSLYVLSLPVRN